MGLSGIARLSGLLGLLGLRAKVSRPPYSKASHGHLVSRNLKREVTIRGTIYKVYYSGCEGGPGTSYSLIWEYHLANS